MKTPVIGIIGSGQLADMLCHAAGKLALQTIIYSDKHGPANKSGKQYFIGEYNNENKLKQFCQLVDIVTFEFENIPQICFDIIKSNKITILPEPEFLNLISDRLSEKELIQQAGAEVASFAQINKSQDIEQFTKQHKFPFIIKTRKFGYDGKGQFLCKNQLDINNFLAKHGHNLKNNFIAESYVNYIHELSILICRNKKDEFCYYDLVKNIHKDAILRTSISNQETDKIFATIKDKALLIGQNICRKYNYIGILAIEFFFLANGKLLVNEIAPRVHNSGHWTIEGAKTSQFEQHIRAICSMNLTSTKRIGDIKMDNIIGEQIHDLASFTKQANATIHNYEKGKWQEGRKMGHITWVNKFLS